MFIVIRLMIMDDHAHTNVNVFIIPPSIHHMYHHHIRHMGASMEYPTPHRMLNK